MPGTPLLELELELELEDELEDELEEDELEEDELEEDELEEDELDEDELEDDEEELESEEELGDPFDPLQPPKPIVREHKYESSSVGLPLPTLHCQFHEINQSILH